MLIKNQIYETQIVDYTSEGQGVAKIEGCAVFIPNAVAGEKVRVRIEKAQKTWAAGKIVEILEKSPHRIARECPISASCGGCDFWQMDYEEETRLKADRVRQCLNRIGGENLTEMPILSAPTCYAYRNKAQYPVAQKKGRGYAGFFRAGTHEVVENQRCLILPEESDQVKDAVIDYVNQFRVPVYDEVAHTGLLRHIYVRRGAVSWHILVCLAINGRAIPHADLLIGELKKIPGFTTLVLSVNTKKGNTVLGDEFITEAHFFCSFQNFSIFLYTQFFFHVDDVFDCFQEEWSNHCDFMDFFNGNTMINQFSNCEQIIRAEFADVV